jgi:hypothetical protein
LKSLRNSFWPDKTIPRYFHTSLKYQKIDQTAFCFFKKKMIILMKKDRDGHFQWRNTLKRSGRRSLKRYMAIDPKQGKNRMRCIHIHPDDNIAIVTGDAAAGDKLECGDAVVVAAGAVPRFNKIALEDIAEGDAVRRYGLPIGIATRNILKGEHVHVHNIRSAWIPTFADRHESAQGDEGARHER